MQYTQLIKEALESPGNAKTMQKLKEWPGELPCLNCGSPSRLNGVKRYKDTSTAQEYKCKSCGLRYTIITILHEEERRRYPPCPRCGTNIHVMRKGFSEAKRQRFLCTSCGHFFKKSLRA